MGKPTGFMEYERAPHKERAPRERIEDWREIYAPYDRETLKEQGARCMDCGVPFCHTGKIISGMASGCPINNLIPEWNDLVYRGHWHEAYIQLAKTNNFPEFTGRVCPAPCESACTLGINESPVTIKPIEVSIVDRAFAEGWIVPEPPQVRTGKRVAVVGSGPAGLAAAQQLCRAGHEVTVFERDDRPGGLLVYGIPNMKLDKDLVHRRLDLLAAEGVQFVTHTEIGRDITTDELMRDYDAVVLCGGATQARDLAIPGRSLRGVYLAMAYLTASTKALLEGRSPDLASISAKNKAVVVLGGGDTGTDCVGTAIRQGAKSVVQLEILPRPPDARASDNPWPEWPKVYQLDYGQKEAQALWGEDPRQYQMQTKRFVGDTSGNVKRLHAVQVAWCSQGGRWSASEVPGSERVIEADLVLLALGFVGSERPMLEQLGARLDERGNVWVDDDKMTSVPGVFAAGDMVRGQSLVVWAIREGRQVARAVDRYLSYGETVLPP